MRLQALETGRRHAGGEREPFPFAAGQIRDGMQPGELHRHDRKPEFYALFRDRHAQRDADRLQVFYAHLLAPRGAHTERNHVEVITDLKSRDNFAG